jgi:3-hydroxyacyl-[acyl-carrier-protein] dehydratase
MSRAAIEAAIPHREPFLLIDEIVQQSDDTIRCRKTFRADEWFFRGHYPDFLLSKIVDASDGVPVATRANDVKFKKMVRPGDTVEIEARLKERLADAFFLTGKVTCVGQLACRLDFAVTITKP